ncbi:hypothetical protein [Ramlibacter sp.]|uniref:hypothetical protein n=1 Tax=Ramlibacter sp. TaxID=1917967 RepID=UPI002D4464F0|nr:hypothetical protein [Ramlibacter sp.]HYD75451.1 hypothetical protein [Ramlibacter sp.]
MDAVPSTARSLAVVGALMLAAGSASAQLASPSTDPWSASPTSATGRLGLRPLSVPIGCGASLLPCETEAIDLQARRPDTGFHWNVELAPLRLGTADRLSPNAEREGLNLSLVGRQPLFGSRFSVYGKLGTTYGYPEAGTPLLGSTGAGPDGAYGLSFGAGLSMAVTPRLSATLGLDSHELRLGAGGREAVRAVGLGLQYRY